MKPRTMGEARERELRDETWRPGWPLGWRAALREVLAELDAERAAHVRTRHLLENLQRAANDDHDITLAIGM